MDVVLLVSGTCAENGTVLAGWYFVYDGDGTRVKQVYTDGNGSLTTYYFFGGSYEVQDDGTNTTTRVYYAFAGMTIAMKDGTGLKYFLADHLGSVVAVTDDSSALLSEQRTCPSGRCARTWGAFHTPVLLSSYIPGAVSVYFFTYVMKNLALASAVAPIQLIGLLLGIFLSAFISRMLGKKRSYIVAALAMIIVSAIRWLDPTSLALIYISTIIGGFILGSFKPVTQVIAGDNIDYVEYKMKYRSEAASGIAGAIPGYVLGWAGYVATSQTQPANVITVIIWLTIGFPIFFFAASALIFGFGYNLDKNSLHKVEVELSERRALNQASPK
jgi:hypothetical protein